MPQQYTAPRFAFDADTLHIRTTFHEMRISWSPEPRAEERNGKPEWKGFLPEFRLIVPPRREEAQTGDISDKDAAFSAFRASIPEAVARLVEPFTNHQWKLMCLLHARPQMLDWAIQNPLLAYCVANNDELRGTGTEPAATMALVYSSRKQRMILRWLGFPPTAALVRLMQRIQPAAVDPSSLRRLRAALACNKNVVNLLAPFDRINTGMLDLVGHPMALPLVTSDLLREVANAPEERDASPTCSLLLDSLIMMERLPFEAEVKPFHSISRLRAFHDAFLAGRLMRDQLKTPKRATAIPPPWAVLGPVNPAALPAAPSQVCSRQLCATCVRRFPAPPLPRTRHIVPITCGLQLEAEGREQRHCAATYENRILKGGIFIYQVLHPQRATLSIIKGPDGMWRVEQLRLRGNAAVSGATSKLVGEWLNKHSLSARTTNGGQNGGNCH